MHKVIWICISHFLFSGPVFAAQEEILNFKLKTCVGAFCYQVEATRATKGAFSHFFVLEGEVRMTRFAGQDRKDVWSGSDAFYDPTASTFLLRSERADVLLEMLNGKATAFPKL